METQIDLFDISLSAPITPNPAPQPSNDPDAFGCCSRYRACSSAHHCLIPDLDYSVHCSYRKNLEAGRTFYGKSADGFSMAEYTEFKRRVNMLSSSARSTLDNILINLCEYNRGVRRTIVRKSCISDLQALGLFHFQPLQSAFPRLCSYQVLKPAVSEHPQYGPLFRQAQAIRAAELAPLRDAKREAKKRGDKAEFIRLDNELKRLNKASKPSENTKEFLTRWMNKDGIPLRDEMADPYRFAYIIPSVALYIEELYRDMILPTYDDGRIYELSPLATDGWRTLYDWEEDELRRVKLSHGYSPEEKAHRIAKIEQVRAARAAERKRKKESQQEEDDTE